MRTTVNGQVFEVPADWRQDSLLDVLREAAGLVGAKYGCGAGTCGACTMLLDSAPVRACITPVAAAEGRSVETIEGLAAPDGTLHPVQQAWVALAVPQCGYCQAGMLMGTVALLRRSPRPTPQEVDAALAGHLCRCGTQHRVRAAIARAAGAGTQVRP